ncbi:MAG TPA: FAD-binding oxidoreductase [Holophagaceae bacterium]|nr:FAD-binding oxidoreductase [Holophagaceae bacterium]
MILQDWWYTTLLDLPYPFQKPLCEHIEADALVVGGGAAGLAAALRLSETPGKRVVLIDRNICGGSSTGRSAGFLTPDSELELSQLVRRYGAAGAKDTWECAVRGIERMVSVVKEHGLDCDLQVQDSLFVGNDAGGWKDALEEVEARKLLGYEQTVIPAADIPKVLGSDQYAGAIRYPGTYGINALRYAQGAKNALLGRGVRIYEATEALTLKDHTVTTHKGSITADQIIFCIDKPAERICSYEPEVYHAQTFLCISEPLEGEEAARLFPDGPLQCWDSDLVYTYWRLTGDQRLLLGGGSMLTTFAKGYRAKPDVIESVIARFKEKFPYLENLSFIQYWPGLIDCTRDLMPTLVREPERPWVHWVLGCVGLPWATFCGDFAARHAFESECQDDHRYYKYFAEARGFLVPTWLEPLMGKQMVFSLNNAWAKYAQVDKGKRDTYRAGEF